MVRPLSGAAEAAATDAPVSIPTGLVAGLRSFATEHGGATAVVEYAGRKGARIVLTGADGSIGAEHYVDSTQAARAACAHAGISLDNEWERELEEQTLSNGLWRTMGRRVLSR
jgi:heterodisulfide reductase subunit C